MLSTQLPGGESILSETEENRTSKRMGGLCLSRKSIERERRREMSRDEFRLAFQLVDSDGDARVTADQLLLAFVQVGLSSGNVFDSKLKSGIETRLTKEAMCDLLGSEPEDLNQINMSEFRMLCSGKISPGGARSGSRIDFERLGETFYFLATRARPPQAVRVEAAKACDCNAR